MSLPIYYWDTCTFLAFLNGETTHDSVAIACMKQIADDFDKGRAVLVTSSLTMLEVLENRNGGAYLEFSRMRDSRYFEFVNINPNILDLAYKVRNIAWKSDSGKTISTPDAIHIASAMAKGLPVMYTLDKNNRGDSLGLIKQRTLQVDSHAINFQLPSIQPPKKSNHPTGQSKMFEADDE